jgi:hypothetical protein
LAVINLALAVWIWHTGENSQNENHPRGFDYLQGKENRMTTENAQETLKRILGGLKSADTTEQLAAIQELETIKYSSEAIVAQLEKLAVHGEGGVQKFALAALNLTTSQSVVSKHSDISKPSRSLIIREIDDWHADGLLDPQRAETIKRRYDFDIIPGMPVKAIASEPVEAKPAQLISPTPSPALVLGTSVDQTQGKPVPAPIAAPQPLQPQPASPPKPAEPRPSLTQVLLSETSVRIYLYLGAFFVIASAAILAALVEAARLPILLIATFIFAAGAVGFKKRLPQPSFAFAVVFSFLLPIDAGVLADTFALSARANDLYWSTVYILTALIWAFGTWFYESRMFSIASLIAFTGSAIWLENALNLSDDWVVCSMGFASLVGLLGVYILKNWKDQKFARPLFITAQILQGLTLLISLGMIAVNLFESDVAPNVWIAHTLTWLFAASFYAASDLLIPFLFFPWMSATSLFLIPGLLLSAFNATTLLLILGWWIWGALIGLCSELAQSAKNERVQKYNIPLLRISLLVFLVAILWGLIENIQYGFAALLGTFIVYTLIHALRPRWYVWGTALVSGLGAYFAFFALPFMQEVNIYFGYQLLGASLLLLIPEIFFKEPLTFTRQSNWPPVVLGILVLGYSLLFIHISLFESGIYFAQAALIMGVYTLLFAAHTLRFKQPLLGYLATTSLVLTIVYALTNYKLDYWLPTLTALTVVYYVAGYLLARKDQTQNWCGLFINSGLGLGTIISLIAVFTLKPAGGWYALVCATLFAIELFTRRNAYLEFLVETLVSIALIINLNDFKVHEIVYYFFGLSLIWLALDAAFKLSFTERQLGLIATGIGALLTFVTVFTITINNRLASAPAATCFGVYTAFFATYALIYKKPMPGYLSTASAAVTMFYALDHFNITTWLPIFTGLSVAYYFAGFWIRKQSAGWSEMFRYSGLALGSLVTGIALINLEATGGWYAVVIGLLFVIETISARNGWLEAGVHLMFSIAALLILLDFNINEYSYILLALSLVWLGGDMIFHKTFRERKLELPVRLVGTAIAALNFWSLLFGPAIEATICYGVSTVFLAAYAWLYQKPLLAYASTVSLPLAVFFALRAADRNGWLFALIAIAALYYGTGYFLRRVTAANGWDKMFLFSGLGLGTLVAIAAPFQDGNAEKAIPIAIAATFFAVEAYARKNVWLAFPANTLYLISYFTLLVELNVDEPQYFSIGAALLGMLMHYLLVQANSKTGAFTMGMVSQLVLLGTTYIQMTSTSKLSFFFVLFTQSMLILIYGIPMRSRSLVIAPISFAVLGVSTVLYSALKDLSLVVIIGVTGISLLVLGILAVLMRERITTLAERFSDWNA